MSGGIIARRTREAVPIAYPAILTDGGFSWLTTDTSRTFIAIAYDAANERLRVVFRDSGRQLEYAGFNAMRFFNLRRARSKGRYWKRYIMPLQGTEIILGREKEL
jgi:hypothetical protein